jgi:hypothetical protein
MVDSVIVDIVAVRRRALRMSRSFEDRRQWEITTLIVAEELCFFERIFRGTHNWEGVSLVRFRQGKIGFVREYCTTSSLYESREAEKR